MSKENVFWGVFWGVFWIIVVACFFAFLSIVVFETQKTNRMFIQAGYEQATLQGSDCQAWVKSGK